MANKFWGNVFEIGSGMFVLPVALGNGAIRAIKGEKFEDGFDHVFNACEDTLEKIGEFGDKHHDKINETVVTTTATVAIGLVTGNFKSQKGLKG